MNVDEIILSIRENLQIVTDFVDSDDYKYMQSAEGMQSSEIHDWIKDFKLHHKSFNFFFEQDPVSERTLYESHTLAIKVCNFLGYE